MSLRFPRSTAIALVLALVGWQLNSLPVPLGWGLDLVLGNTLVWAGLRVVGPWLTVFALSAVSAQTIFLWNHPWAWLIWTLEAVAVAFLYRRETQIGVDIAFWILIGAPLLAITYGLVMGTDWLSVGLVIAKQAFNGLLCVTMGEILYLSATEVSRRIGSFNPPRMRFRSMMMALLMSFVLIPAAVYTYLNGLAGMTALTNGLDARLEQAIQENRSGFGAWLVERRDALRALAAQSADAEPSCDDPPKARIAGDPYWILPLLNCKVIDRKHALMQTDLMTDGLLSDVHSGSAEKDDHVEFLAATPDPARLVYNVISEDSLRTRFDELESRQDIGLLLLDRNRHLTVQIPTRNADPATLNQLAVTVTATDIPETAVITAGGFGQSVMTDYKKSLLARSVRLDAPADGWHLVVMLSPKEGILAARQAQLLGLGAMLALASLAAILGALITHYGEVMFADLYRALSRIAEPVSEGRIHRLLSVQEIDAIQEELERAGQIFREDRALMGAYERRMRQIEAHAPVIVYSAIVKDGMKGQLSYVSASAERILGFDLKEITAPGWWSHAVHPDDYDYVNRQFADLQTKSTANAEYRLRRQDGTYRSIYDTLTVGDNGEAVGVILDITRRKLAELQVIQSAKLASLGEMATGMAHELNQPLNVIKMAGSNLMRRVRSGTVNADHLKERLQRIVDQADRASALIGHMKIFGRKPDEAPSAFLVRRAIDGAIGLIGTQIAISDVELTVEDDTEGLKVMGHQTLLEQVLINLLLNSRDVIVDRVDGGEARARWIRITLERRGDAAVLQVEDSGGGIPQDALGRVFEPFFTTKPVHSGTGLGLSVSYGIVGDMRGTIEVENVELGARFTIRLPAA